MKNNKLNRGSKRRKLTKYNAGTNNGLADKDIEVIGNDNAEKEYDVYPPWPIQDEYEFRYRNNGG